jgi:hypothetical protein
LRLSSFAQVDLGLSRDEFYGLTPEEFGALCRRHERGTEEREFLFAQLTACVVNFSHWRSQPKEQAHPKQFMPSQWERKSAGKLRRRSVKAISDEWERTMERAVAYQAAQVARGIG